MPASELVFRLKAEFLKALAHPVRLAVLEELRGGERSVGSMVAALGVEQPSLSKHLALLRQAGIVSARPSGSNVHYSIRDRSVFGVLKPITDILRKRLRDGQKVLEGLGA